MQQQKKTTPSHSFGKKRAEKANRDERGEGSERVSVLQVKSAKQGSSLSQARLI
jgi:hypothetical protein